MKSRIKEAVLPYKPNAGTEAGLKRVRDDFRIFGGWYAMLKDKGKFKYSKDEILHKFLIPGLRELMREGSTEFHADKWKKWSKEIYLEAFDKIVTKFRYLVAPHAELIYKGKKTATVHARRFIQGSFVSIVGPGYEFGFARFEEGKKIGWPEFAARRDEHEISENERQEWWPGKKELYYYKLRTWIPLEKPRHVRVPKGTQTYGERSRLNEGFELDEARHRKDACMRCSEKPEYDVLWANGMGRCWFCTKHFREWIKEQRTDAKETGYALDVDAVKKVDDGIVPDKWADNRNTALKKNLCRIMKEDAIKDFEYLLHHIEIEGGKEEVHHCLLYDHNANLFEQGHLWIDKGKVFLDGKEIKDGTYHVLTGLESKQEVAWSDEEAEKGGIKPKKMIAGMTLKQKGKEW